MDLPNELWTKIFGTIPSSADLNKVAKTCKRFYSLALPILYGRIVFKDPQQFAKNLDFWKAHPTFITIPRSLVVSVSSLSPFNRQKGISVVGLSGRFHRILPTPVTTNNGRVAPVTLVHRPRSTTNIPPVASKALYGALLRRISSFSSLEELVLQEVHLPLNFYNFILSFKNLKRLEVSSCFLPPQRNHEFSAAKPSCSSITSLTILDMKLGSAERLSRIVSASNIKSLHTDWSSDILRYFARPPSLRISPKLPLSLRVLKIDMPPDSSIMEERAEILTLFLRLCPSVLDLTFTGHIHSLPLPYNALPDLRSFTGPFFTAASLARFRPIEHIDACSKLIRCGDFSELFPLMTANCRNLQTLSITVSEWDEEFLYGVTQECPQLYEFKMQYEKGGPSDACLVGLGAQFLTRIPHIRTFQIYNPLDTLKDFSKRGAIIEDVLDYNGIPLLIDWGDEPIVSEDPETELYRFIVSWRKYCPNLREVQLINGFTWRREKEDGEWYKREYKLVNGERIFAFLGNFDAF